LTYRSGNELFSIKQLNEFYDEAKFPITAIKEPQKRFVLDFTKKNQKDSAMQKITSFY